MTNQDDEKILRFAGYRYKLSASENPHYWVDPDGMAVDCDVSGDTIFPDTADLTWLFKWCVPKLDCYRLSTHWGVDSHEPSLRKPTKFHDAEVEIGHGNVATAMRYVGHGNTPGEALRAAILALVGEGK